MNDRLFTDFNFSLLNDPRFKEDSVREELISPLIKYLGYSNTGNTQVIRSHGLKHPFVSVGTTRKKITVIPDYLMKIAEKPAWVLEAKSPAQSINETRHAEQAYSYAIHPEIRVNYFALCNGREFVLYNISQEKPMFQIPLQAMNENKLKEFIKELLCPEKIFSPRNVTFSKDLGLHMKRLGFTPADSVLILAARPAYIIKYNDDLFSFPSPISIDGATYMGSFDFNLATAMQLQNFIDPKSFQAFLQPTKNGLLKFHFPENFLLNIRVALPEKEDLIENDKEIYLPVIVKEFIHL